jgi:hypothetical protein
VIQDNARKEKSEQKGEDLSQIHKFQHDYLKPYEVGLSANLDKNVTEKSQYGGEIHGDAPDAHQLQRIRVIRGLSDFVAAAEKNEQHDQQQIARP